MAANDKITPTSLLIANNLKGTKYSTKNTYKLTPKNTGKYKNVYTDAVDFLASVYAKELKVADFNDLWNFRNADEAPNKAQYTPNKNANYEVLGQIVAFSELEWDELQITISKAFNNIYPFDLASLAGVYTPSEQAYYLSQMGVLNGGATITKVLYNANAVSLGTFNQGVAYANAWNSLKVPADAALGVDTPYLAPIYKPASGLKHYYRYTGKRRWASPFSGYDLY
jgi:hypothetical protein